MRVLSPGKRGDDASPLRAIIASGLIASLTLCAASGEHSDGDGHGAAGERAAVALPEHRAIGRARRAAGAVGPGYSASRPELAGGERRQARALAQLSCSCRRRGDLQRCAADNSILSKALDNPVRLAVALTCWCFASSPRQLHTPRNSQADRNLATWHIPCLTPPPS